MRYLMRVEHSETSTQGPIYLRGFDHEANLGTGHALLTHDPEQALGFSSPEQARAFWERTNSRGRTPLKALSVELVSLQVAKLIYTNRSKTLSKYR